MPTIQTVDMRRLVDRAWTRPVLPCLLNERTIHMRRHLAPGLCIAALLALTACGSDDDASSDSSTVATAEVDGSGVTTESSATDGSTDDSTDSSTAGSTKTTVAGSGTTVVGSTGTTVVGSTGATVAGSTGTTVAGSGTTAPGTTNAVPKAPEDLTLLADGLGPLRFGADSAAVVSAVDAVLGQPVSDAPAEYPNSVEGAFHSQDEELEFIKPFGRTVCWLNGLCIEFGGTTAGPYSFVGWYYAATDTDELAAPSGLDVGSTWADFAGVMTVDTGGCFSVGSGASNGVRLTLQSSGTPFVTVDDVGNETPTTPDPADVTVVQMQAGEQVVFLLGDC